MVKKCINFTIYKNQKNKYSSFSEMSNLLTNEGEFFPFIIDFCPWEIS